MSFFFNKIITARKRMIYTGSKSVLTNSTGWVALDCKLEPLSSQMASQSGMQWGDSFQVYVPQGTDILETDSITIGGVEYNVKGTQDWSGQTPEYKVLLVVKKE
jgi:hypothetical protein